MNRTGIALLGVLLASAAVPALAGDPTVVYRSTPHVLSTMPATGATQPGSSSGPLTAAPSASSYSFAKNQDWSVAFAATGGTAPYAFTGIGLPTGISVGSDGVLRGVAAPDVYTGVGVRASDAAGASALSTTVTVAVGAPSLLSVVQPSGGFDLYAPEAQGTPAVVTFVNDGERPYAMPAMTATGPFVVTATTCGARLVGGASCTATVAASAAGGTVAAASGGMSGMLAGSVPLVGTAWTPSVAMAGQALTAEAGTPFAFDFATLATVTGAPSGTKATSFASADKPSWMTLATDGKAAGTPTSAGTASLNVVGSFRQASGTRSYVLTIGNATFRAQQLAAGSEHVCALQSGGAVTCWGSNGAGQLGIGSTTGRTSPGAVPAIASGATQIAAGGNSTCALMTGGSVNCWGSNVFGQLGTGGTSNKTSPGTTTAIASGAVQIALGAYHACALMSDGAVNCWGMNTQGQLGTGNTTDKTSPGTTVAIASGATSVAVGLTHTCAVVAGGAVNCWGNNNNYQLGTGNTTNKTSPGTTTSVSSDATQVAAFDNHTCALFSNGAVNCWGANSYGQLGTGNTTIKTSPGTTTAIASGASRISAGSGSVCAVASGGAVNCWGMNAFGQLGTGGTTNKTSPGSTPAIASGAVQVVSGNVFTCALLSGGTANCWGNNGSGQLGTGNATDKYSPGTTVVVPN